MALTNELPNSFFNSGYLQTNSQVYKKFLEKRADNLPKKQEYFDEYSKLRREARAFDSSKGLSPEDLVEIDRFFNEKFPRVQTKIAQLLNEDKNKKTIVENNANPITSQGIIQSEKDSKTEGSFIKQIHTKYVPYNSANSSNKSSSSIYDDNGYKDRNRVYIHKTHFPVWNHMKDNYGLKFDDYVEACNYLDFSKRNRFLQSITDIDAIFKDVNKKYGVTKRDFGQLFKYSLLGMPQRLELLECFGISIEDISRDNYINACIFSVNFNQLEYMLKLAVLGNVDLTRSLGTVAKHSKDMLLAKYIKFIETRAGDDILSTPITEDECNQIIATKGDYYYKNHIIEDRYKKSCPISDACVQEFIENRCYPMMAIGLIIKKFEISYIDAKKFVEANPQCFNMKSGYINERLSSLIDLNFNFMQILENPRILGLPKEKVTPRVAIARLIGINNETFLKYYIMSSEDKVYARIMGNPNLKQSYYYANEQTFHKYTGLSTEELQERYKLTPNIIAGLVHKSKTAMLVAEKYAKLSQEEIELRDFLHETYNVTHLNFAAKRNLLLSNNLQFSSTAIAKIIIQLLKTEYQLADEKVWVLFDKCPELFTPLYQEILGRYQYYKENFDASKKDYQEMLLSFNKNVLFDDNHVENFETLRSRLSQDYNFNIEKVDYVNMLKNLSGVDASRSITVYIYNTISELYNFKVDLTKIGSRYEFLNYNASREIQLRLMLMHLLDKSAEHFLTNSKYPLPISTIIERYMLYKQGEIPKKAVFVDQETFGRYNPGVLPVYSFSELPNFYSQVQVVKDFIAKMQQMQQKIEMGINVNFFEDAKLSDDTIKIKNKAYLQYMLCYILGFEDNNELILKIKSSKGSLRMQSLNSLFARVTGISQFQCDPIKYFLQEEEFARLTNCSTDDLVKQYQLTDEAANLIHKYYSMIHADEQFDIKPEKIEKEKTDVNIEKSAN